MNHDLFLPLMVFEILLQFGEFSGPVLEAENEEKVYILEEVFDFRGQEINAGYWSVCDIAEEEEEEEEKGVFSRNKLFNHSEETEDIAEEEEVGVFIFNDNEGSEDEPDFRLQEINIPEWAVDLFNLQHAGKWTVYDIAGYDPMDRIEEEEITLPRVKKDKWINRLYRRARAKFSFDRFHSSFAIYYYCFFGSQVVSIYY